MQYNTNSILCKSILAEVFIKLPGFLIVINEQVLVYPISKCKSNKTNKIKDRSTC